MVRMFDRTTQIDIIPHQTPNRLFGKKFLPSWYKDENRRPTEAVFSPECCDD